MDTLSQLYMEDMSEVLSVLFSNLSKACTKQLRLEEAELFNKLSLYFENKMGTLKENVLSDIGALIEADLDLKYGNAMNVAKMEKDRGALRALTWGEKATRIQNSVLSRYEKQKDELLKNKNVFVCEICGYIHIGDEAPDICPICKVPKFKFSKIE